MIDFMKISTRQVKKGVTEIFPKFVLKKSSDLMIRGGDFYAVWNEDTGLWSTDEEDVINMVDAALYEYTKKQEEHGTVFKNNSGSTVLTAHVYKGAVEQTVADNGTVSGLGTIKWYKVGSDTAVATAKTLTVSANDVDNTQAYTCQLEG